jgi:hypothetical protein
MGLVALLLAYEPLQRDLPDSRYREKSSGVKKAREAG